MEKENAEVGFILNSIKTEQFALFELNYNAEKQTNLKRSIQFKLDQTNKRIGVFLGFEFIQEEKIFIKIVVSCHFIIKEDSWEKFINLKQAKVIVPKGFLAHIAMITMGTCRGILFAKTEGTVFSKFIIPTLNVEKMIKSDAEFILKT